MLQTQFRPRFNQTVTKAYLEKYYQDPIKFNEYQVNTLKQHANHYGYDFTPITKDQLDFNFFRAVKEFGEGYLSGFTTLNIGQDSYNPIERVFKASGRAMGFIGFVPSFGLAPLKIASQALRGKSIPLLASKALERKVAPIAGKMVASLAGSQSSAVRGVSSFLMKDVPKDVIQGMFQVGVAGSISNWQQGIDGMLQGLAGGSFLELGDRIIANTLRLGTSGQNQVMRTIAGALWNGLPSTLRKQSAPEQVFDYLTGGLFAYNDVPAYERIANEYVGKMRKKNTLIPEALDDWQALSEPAKIQVKKTAEERFGTKDYLDKLTYSIYAKAEEDVNQKMDIVKNNINTIKTIVDSEMQINPNDIENTDIQKAYKNSLALGNKAPLAELQQKYLDEQNMLDNTPDKWNRIKEIVIEKQRDLLKEKESILAELDGVKNEVSKQNEQEEGLGVVSQDIVAQDADLNASVKNIEKAVTNAISETREIDFQGKFLEDVTETLAKELNLSPDVIRDDVNTLLLYANDQKTNDFVNFAESVSKLPIGQREQNALIMANSLVIDKEGQTLVNPYEKSSVMALVDDYWTGKYDDQTTDYNWEGIKASIEKNNPEAILTVDYLETLGTTKFEAVNAGLLSMGYQDFGTGTWVKRSDANKSAVSRFVQVVNDTRNNYAEDISGTMDRQLAKSRKTVQSILSTLYKEAYGDSKSDQFIGLVANASKKFEHLVINTQKTPEEILESIKLYETFNLKEETIKDVRAKVNQIRSVKDFKTYVWDDNLGEYLSVTESYYKINNQVVGAMMPTGNTFEEIGRKYPDRYVDENGKASSPFTWVSYAVSGKKTYTLNDMGEDAPMVTPAMLFGMDKMGKLPLSGVGDKKKIIMADVHPKLDDAIKAGEDETQVVNKLFDQFIVNQKAQDQGVDFDSLIRMDREAFSDYFKADPTEGNIDHLYKKTYINNHLWFKDILGFSDFSTIKENDFIQTGKAINKRMQIISTNGNPVGGNTQAELDDWGRIYTRFKKGANIESADPFNLKYMIYNKQLDDYDFENTFSFSANDDGGIYVTPEYMKALNYYSGVKGTAFNKSFIVSEDPNLGLLLGKYAFHIASGKELAYMREKGIDMLMSQDEAKQRGYRQFDTVYTMKPRDIRVIPGEYANEHYLDNTSLVKQARTMVTFEDYINYKGEKRLGSWVQERFKDMNDYFIEKTKSGKKETNDAFELYRSTKDEKQLVKVLNEIDDLSLDNLSYLINNFESPKALRRTLEAIVNKQKFYEDDDDSEVLDGDTRQETSYDRASANIFSKSQDDETAKNFLFNTESDNIVYDENVIKFSQTILKKYVEQRLTRPMAENSAVARIRGLSHFNKGTEYANIKQDEFYLGAGFKAKKITFWNGKQNVTETLGNIFEAYKVATDEMKPYLEKAMNALVLRVPMDSIEGAQKLKLKGFLDVDGYDILVHGFAKEMVGGADDDGDKTFIYFGGMDEAGNGAGFKESWMDIYADRKYNRVDFGGDKPRIQLDVSKQYQLNADTNKQAFVEKIKEMSPDIQSAEMSSEIVPEAKLSMEELDDIIYNSNLRAILFPDLRSLYLNSARLKGFSISPDKASIYFLKNILKEAKKNPDEITTDIEEIEDLITDAISNIEKGNYTEATVLGEMALSRLHDDLSRYVIRKSKEKIVAQSKEQQADMSPEAPKTQPTIVNYKKKYKDVLTTENEAVSALMNSKALQYAPGRILKASHGASIGRDQLGLTVSSASRIIAGHNIMKANGNPFTYQWRKAKKGSKAQYLIINPKADIREALEMLGGQVGCGSDPMDVAGLKSSDIFFKELFTRFFDIKFSDEVLSGEEALDVMKEAFDRQTQFKAIATINKAMYSRNYADDSPWTLDQVNTMMQEAKKNLLGNNYGSLYQTLVDNRPEMNYNANSLVNEEIADRVKHNFSRIKGKVSPDVNKVLKALIMPEILDFKISYNEEAQFKMLNDLYDTAVNLRVIELVKDDTSPEAIEIYKNLRDKAIVVKELVKEYAQAGHSKSMLLLSNEIDIFRNTLTGKQAQFFNTILLSRWSPVNGIKVDGEDMTANSFKEIKLATIFDQAKVMHTKFMETSPNTWMAKSGVVSSKDIDAIYDKISVITQTPKITAESINIAKANLNSDIKTKTVSVENLSPEDKILLTSTPATGLTVDKLAGKVKEKSYDVIMGTTREMLVNRVKDIDITLDQVKKDIETAGLRAELYDYNKQITKQETILEGDKLFSSISDHLKHYKILPGYLNPIARGIIHKEVSAFTLEDWTALDNFFKDLRTPGIFQRIRGLKKDSDPVLSRWHYYLLPDAINKDLMIKAIDYIPEVTAYIDKDGNDKIGYSLQPMSTMGKLQETLAQTNARSIKMKETDEAEFYKQLYPYRALPEGNKLFELAVWEREKNYYNSPEYTALYESQMQNNKAILDKVYDVNVGDKIEKLSGRDIIKRYNESITMFNNKYTIIQRGNIEKRTVFDKDGYPVRDPKLGFTNRVETVNLTLKKYETGTVKIGKGENAFEVPEYNVGKLVKDLQKAMYNQEPFDITIGIDGLNKISQAVFISELVKLNDKLHSPKIEEAVRKLMQSSIPETGQIEMANYFPHRLNEEQKKQLAKTNIKDLGSTVQSFVEGFKAIAKIADIPIGKFDLDSFYYNKNNLKNKMPDDASMTMFDQVYENYYKIKRATADVVYKGSGMYETEEITDIFKKDIDDLLYNEMKKKSLNVREIEGILDYYVVNTQTDNQKVRTDQENFDIERTPEAYVEYMQAQVNMFHRKLGTLLGKHHIHSYLNKELPSDNRHAWGEFFKMYLNDALSYPTILTPAMKADETLKLTYNPYYTFADNHMKDFLYKIGKMLGMYKIPSDIPADHKALFEDILGPSYQNVIRVSQLEAQYQLASLLAHPKSMFTNLYGGSVQTIASAGLSNFVKAQNFSYIKEHINPSWNDRTDAEMWVRKLGVIEEHLLSELGRIGTSHGASFAEFARIAIAKIAKDPNFKDTDLKALAKKHGISDFLLDKAGWFMRVSERKLRTDAFLAHYIQGQQRFNNLLPEFDANGEFKGNPYLIKMAIKGVENTQYMYSATHRPAFARTAFGKILTRFQLYAMNTISLRKELYDNAKIYGYGSHEFDRFARFAVADMISLALSSAFMYTLFDYALPSPYNYFQDLANFMFGDEESKRRAFFGSYPYPLSPLQMITPPVARAFPALVTALATNEWKTFTDYQVWAMFPFGRLARDINRSYSNPDKVIDYMTGLPVSRLKNEKKEAEKEGKEWKNKYVISGLF